MVEIATTNDHGNDVLDVPLGSPIEYMGVSVRFFERYSPSLHAVREFAYSRTFKAWLKQNITNYDLVHVHALFSFTSSYAMYCARQHAVPYVAHPIGSLEDWSMKQGSMKKKLYVNLIEKRNLEGANRVHFTAESERAQAMAKISNIKPAVIPLGLDLPDLADNARQIICQEYDLDERFPILLFLGRLHEKKGLHLLIDAIAANKESKLNVLIAGEGNAEYTNELHTQIRKLSLSSVCQFTGYVSGQEKAHLLQGADLFVLPSSSENFGIAVLEASSYATAVLVSPWVALSKAVREFKIGVVCDNTQESLSQTLSGLAQQKTELIEMGKRGRKYVEQKHQWASIACDLHAEYTSVLEEISR